MSRGGGGTYTLPAGNPVVTGTTITSAWANGTLTDIASALTDSLSRSGLGGMTAVLLGVDGTAAAPAYSFTSDPDTGMYRVGGDTVGIALGGVQRFEVNLNGIYSPLGDAASVAHGFIGDTNTGLYSPGADQIAVVTGGNVRIGVGATGNVTINAPLSGEAVRVNGLLTGVAQSWYNTGGTATATIFLDNTIVSFGTSTATPIQIASSGLPRIAIAAFGNVTINAPLSGTPLTVNNGADGALLSMVRTGGNATQLNVSATDATDVTLNVTGSAARALNLATFGSTRMIIGGAGNVTINAPASGAALTVNTTAGGAGLFVTDGTITNRMQFAVGTAVEFGPFTNHALNFVTNSLTRALIGAAGNVTINAPSSGITVAVNGVGGGTGMTVLGGAVGIEVTSGTTTSPCISYRGNIASAEAMDFDSNVTSTASAAPVLTANKPGGGTSILTWIRVDVAGTRGWIPVWNN